METSIEEKSQRIAASQDTLMGLMAGRDVTAVGRFRYIPYIALEADAAGLQALLEADDVSRVYEDITLSPSLATTVPVVGGNDAHAWGFTGAGQTIAILDTGVERGHPFLSGRVASEACYSTLAPSTSVSLCPNGLATQLGTGAADPTTAACMNGTEDLCWHGTHVAGIAAGSGVTSRGVAPAAKIAFTAAAGPRMHNAAGVRCPAGAP